MLGMKVRNKRREEYKRRERKKKMNEGWNERTTVNISAIESIYDHLLGFFKARIYF